MRSRGLLSLRRKRKLLWPAAILSGLKDMDVLILGGTVLLGAAVANAAAERGRVVTCLARGSSTVFAGTTFVTADCDEDDGLAAVVARWSASRCWPPRVIRSNAG